MTLDRLVRLTVDDYDLGAERSRAKERQVTGHAPGNVEVAGLFVCTDEGTHLDSASGGGDRLFGERPEVLANGAAEDARSIAADLARVLASETRRAFPRRDLGALHWCADSNRARSLAVAELRARKLAALAAQYGEEGLRDRLRRLGLDPAHWTPAVLEPERPHATLDDAGTLVLGAEDTGSAATFDRRSLAELTAAGVVLVDGRADGRIPVDLCAGAIVDVFASEASRIEACAAQGLPIVLDESSTFGRTGAPFAGEPLGLDPTMLVLGSTQGPGVLLADAPLHAGVASPETLPPLESLRASRQDLERLLHDRDPLFEGRSYSENLRIKGEYLRAVLIEIAQRHPDLLVDLRGRGGAFRLVVRRREALVREAWRRGLLLRPVGPDREESELEILLPADVRTREIDVLWEAIDRLFAVMGTQESVLGEGGRTGPEGIGD